MGNYRKDKLTLSYNKGKKDFIVAYPRKCDGNLILNKILGDVLEWGGISEEGRQRGYLNYERCNLKEELDKRGYDITTLKFSIELKKEAINSSK